MHQKPRKTETKSIKNKEKNHKKRELKQNKHKIICLKYS